MDKFSPGNIPKIFGFEDAADEDAERLKEYFVKRADYESVKLDLPLSIIVGSKGVGKSALLKVCYEEDKQDEIPALWIRPDDVVEMVDELSSDMEFSKMVLSWKRGIAKLIASRIASDWLFVYGDDAKSALMWAQETGYRSRDFIQKTISLLEPRIKKSLNTETNRSPISKGEHHVIERLLEEKKIILYFDDLDAGWEATTSQRRKLSALILALRNMIADIKGMRIRMALRTDVYTLLRESDESTDKFEHYIVDCNWNNHDILVLLVKRLITYYKKNISDEELNKKTQQELNGMLSRTFETAFKKSRSWNEKPTYRVLMSLIRSRPRDMIKLCTLAAKETYSRNPSSSVIEDVDIENVLSDYSLNRVQDIVNEFRYEISNLETLLYRMASTKNEIRKKKGRNTYLYTTAELLDKIKNTSENSTLKLAYSDSAKPIEIAHFLYKIGFITARKDDSKRIDRKYYDEKKQLLKSGQIGDGGYGSEIHPAYRSVISTSQKDAWKNTVDIEP